MRQFLNIFFSGTGFCAGKANGNYRDPDNCHGFIQCSNQIAYKQNCNPLWLKYNERKDQCDWPQNVQCGQGRFKTISFKRYFTAARLSCWKADSTSSLGDRCPVDMCYQNKSRYLVKSLCVIWWKIAYSRNTYYSQIGNRMFDVAKVGFAQPLSSKRHFTASRFSYSKADYTSPQWDWYTVDICYHNKPRYPVDSAICYLIEGSVIYQRTVNCALKYNDKTAAVLIGYRMHNAGKVGFE